MPSAPDINSLGLVLDIIGVIMLFMFGLPAGVRRDGASYMLKAREDEAEKKKADFYDGMSWLALCLLIAGFSLQIASNYMA